MGLQLELSELAVIRPIRTAVTTADDVATPTRSAGREEAEDAADTGCVTPTAAAASPNNKPPPQQSGVGVVDEDVEAGCVTPAATTIPTTPPRQGAAVLLDDEASFVTPVSAASVLRPATECPPAPRKPARSPVAAKRKHCGGGQQAPQRCFFPVPRDLTKVFVARGPANSSPPQDAKKIRVYPVG